MKKHGIVADSRTPAKARARRPRREGTAGVPQPLVGAQFLLGVAHDWQLPAAGAPEIAFAGRSNAGKSSAINALARHSRLAYASRTPGRTQQINFFTLRHGGLVADLPGYGYAAVTKSLKRDWQDILWRYVTTRQNLIALTLLVDARRGLTDLDRALLDAFVPSGRPVLLLATKADKLGTTAQRVALAGIEAALSRAFPRGAANVRVLLFSAVTHEGVDAANETIASWLPAGDPPSSANDPAKERPRNQGD